jgi:hypothetical protein
MTGEAHLSPITRPEGAFPTGPTFTVPSTAFFHQADTPAVWVVASPQPTLELRAVMVRSYGNHSSIVTGGLRDGDTVVLAGVHAVYQGERVTVVRPLFDADGEVVGPAPAQGRSAQGAYASNRRLGAGE